ncbi:MAG: carboxypeptidase regulatory-like domain-containing protein [Gemmatimonadales bacterium]|nr:carboxypeptidase regulatory-like domain-containing protein [Gemmatimonadales bacterium]
MLQPPAARPPQRPWSSLAVSAAVHTGFLALVVALSQGAEEPRAGERPDGRADEPRQTQMVYLPPPPERLPPPPEPPPATPPPPPPATAPPPSPAAAPPPSEAQPEPEPEGNAPPEADPTEGSETSQPEGGGTPAPVEEAATMESEARRIFGRPRLATRPGVGPRATRPMEAYIPEDATKCVPRPATPRDSSGTVQFGTVEGRIFRGDGGEPLAGAHLQMIGTPYTAFTDSEGDYSFRFDLSLMDNCRTQYVRVTAKGYESRLLVLLVGPSVRSEDVHLKKRSWW